jgi:hypothetical protein
MKRYLLALLALLFGVSVVGLSIWRSRPPILTLAAENESSVEEIVVETEPAEVLEEDDYSLPYPGILPDHPLYFLKMIRERVRLWLTRDALVRAELMLHYADKRVAASLSLAEKGKAGLAASTATKAEMYLEQALGEAELAAGSGKDTSEFYERALLSSEKHQKVLVGVLSRVPDEAKSVVEAALETNRSGQQRIVEVVGEPEPVSDEEGEGGVEGEEVLDEEVEFKMEGEEKE